MSAEVPSVPPHEDVDLTTSSGDTFHLVFFGEPDAAYQARGESPPPVLFCVHGAGMCASSFFALAAPLTQPCALSASGGRPLRLAAFDMRCHGRSTRAGGEGSLTLDVLSADFVSVLCAAQRRLFPDTSRLFLAGHSLGGAVVVAGLRGGEIGARVGGVVLLDVVEGTARGSLQHMDAFLDKRPNDFASPEEAARWFLQSGGMHSASAAAVAVPPLLRQVGGRFVWRTDLRATAPVWQTWFEGLDAAFVALPFPKMLCLANAERLDVPLTVAQMQGKFQFEIIGNGCGHYLMDDEPTMVAAKIRYFVERIETMSEKLRKCTLKTPEKMTPAS